MKIFKTTPQVDFMGIRNIAVGLSAVLLLISVGGLLVKGLTYGLDFRGGVLIQIKFQQAPQLETVREAFQRRIPTGVGITTFGEAEDNEVIVTFSEGAIGDQYQRITNLVNEILSQSFTGFEIRRVETVGPKAGATLKSKATEAALFALIGILVYIGFRFRIQYGFAAVLALFHDVLITLGFFVFLEKEFTLTIVAAVLTIIGYSLNDTIVVFDRIRENVARFPRKPIAEVINVSINESLSRTILTSLTTFLVVLVMWLLGGEIIHDFCLAMMFGLVVGTYSSIFIASPVVLLFAPENIERNPLFNAIYQWTRRTKSRILGTAKSRAK